MKKITIVIGTLFQDAGEATRSLEIAKGIKKYKPDGVDVRIIFLSRGSRFEQRVIDAGFEIYHAEPKMGGEGFWQDLKPSFEHGEFIGEKSIAIELIKGEIKAYEAIQPDIVLHGFWPIASLARRMVKKEIPGICFVPLPLTEAFFDVIPDVPDQVKILTIFPYKIRLWIFRHLIPHFVKQRISALRQKNIRDAAYELGWSKERLLNIFDLLKSDLMIVNDLPDYYDQSKFPENIVFTGPLFSKATSNDPVDPQIVKVFNPRNNKIKIFCTLSSAGSKEMLKEVVKVFTYGVGLNWNAVILSPHFPIKEARAILGNREGVYITDNFIPAQKVNAMVDIVICHGGQGTVQTAIHSGTPFVGVATQPEQFINLSNIAVRGAGIRIPLAKWNSKNIQKSVSKIIADKKYRKSILLLRERINSIDGEKNAAGAIWGKIKELSII